MKTKQLGILSLMFLCFWGAALAEDFTYTTNNGTITIWRYTGPGGDVTIPDTINGLPVTSIGGWAFSGCTNLTAVTLGDSVTSIRQEAFWGCRGLTTITVNTNNPDYSSVDGVLLNKSQITLIQCPEGKAGSYTIPNSITSIGDGAFMFCTSLTNVIIPSRVTRIRQEAFWGCRGLTSVTIPNSVITIGDSGFFGCTGLTSLMIPNSVLSIGGAAFSGCHSLTNVVIPNRVTSIGAFTFSDCTSLTSVTIPSGVTSIGDGAFSECTSLTSVTIPKSVTSIGDQAFGGCTSLTTITVDALNSFYRSVDGILFSRSQTMLITCPGGKTGSYTIPNSVTAIGEWAFSGCTNLTSVTIPNSVISIGGRAFANSRLTYVMIPDSVTAIGEWAFSGCTSLTGVTLGDSVTTIGNSVFYACTNLTRITVNTNNPDYSSVDGVLFNRSQTKLVQCPGGKAGSYTIPNSITVIGEWAFSGCTSLTSVTIPNSVIAIGEWAFSSCTSLKGVYFQGGSPVIGCCGGAVLSDVSQTTFYYLPGTWGWLTTFSGRPTAPWVRPDPLILNGSARIQTNQFGFTISWATNLSVVIEASTTLTNPTWSPVATNTLTDGWSDFRDPEWLNYPTRFYRVRSQ